MRVDCKNVTLDKIKCTLNLLRRSNVVTNVYEPNGGTSLLEKLQELQHILRHESVDTVDSARILAPFLDILKAPYLAGPFKLVALDAIQTFLSGNLICDVAESLVSISCSDKAHGRHTLSNVVDAVARCKFVQTDATGDELVQLQIVQTLAEAIHGPCRVFLTTNTVLEIVKACHSIMSHLCLAGSSRSTVYNAAERVILDASRFVFVSASSISVKGDTKDVSVALTCKGEGQGEGERSDGGGDFDRTGSCTEQEVDPTTAPWESQITKMASEVMGFFVSIVMKHACDEVGVKGPSLGAGAGAGVPQGPHKHRRALSLSSTSLSSMPLGDTSHNPTAQELLFALKAIYLTLLIEGDLDAARRLIASDPQLGSLVRDDLGKALMLLSGRRDLPHVVLQGILSLVSFCVELLGPTSRILVECSMRFIYLKALLQVRTMFAIHDEAMRVAGDSQATSANSSVSASGGNGATLTTSTKHSGPSSSSRSSGLSGPGGLRAAKDDFSIDELSVILESLVDHLADLSFLPMLFASFDCDPTKIDIAQPLLQYLGTCMRFTLVCEQYEFSSSGLGHITSLIEQCYSQIVISFSRRAVLMSSYSDSASARNIDQKAVHAELTQDDEHKSSGGDGASSGKVLTNSSANSPRDWKLVADKLRLTRQAKGILLEGATLFARKPSDGLRFLQKKGALPATLSPGSVATFLRVAPGLPKESTGSFLGELGKDNPSYEADGKAFHKEVLDAYVQSFELTGQTALNCLRIFLSAFRLPGEAQQIDRILVAFSESCHTACVEGRSGLLENPEVTYLLTFSMIMLNTDLHNPNIRADRKMTVDQFVRNNSFYGKEVNQTKPIPREYLEEIYASLAEIPLRTECNEIGASITPEIWMDLQLQSRIDKVKGYLVTTNCRPKTVKMLMSEAAKLDTEMLSITSDHDYGIVDVVAELLDPRRRDTAIAIAKEQQSVIDIRDASPSHVSIALYDLNWVFDADLLSCCYRELFGVCVAPFYAHRFIVAPSMCTVARNPSSASAVDGSGAITSALDPSTSRGWRKQCASVRALRNGVETSIELMALLHTHCMQEIADSLFIILVECAGMCNTDFNELCSSILGSLNLLDFTAVISAPSTSTFPPASPRHRKNNPTAQPSASDNMMESLLTSLAARSALGAVLSILASNASFLGPISWYVSWLLLAQLRDCTLLPSRMVVEEGFDGGLQGESDLLPPVARAEFEMKLRAAEKQEIARQRALQMKANGGRSSSSLPPGKKSSSSSSILSLQGLGEAIFGSSSSNSSADGNMHTGSPSATSSSTALDDKRQQFWSTSARWDAGYEGLSAEIKPVDSELQKGQQKSLSSASTDTAEDREGAGDGDGIYNDSYLLQGIGLTRAATTLSKIFRNEEGPVDGPRKSVPCDEEEMILAAYLRLKQTVHDCGVEGVISDSRFLNDDTLLQLVISLALTAEAADGFLLELQPVTKSATDIADGSTSYSCPQEDGLSSPEDVVSPNPISKFSGKLLVKMLRSNVSSSSISWAEMLLASVCARNRDRFHVLWPVLMRHYRVTLLDEKSCRLTYSFERRVTGMLKIAARAMVHQEHLDLVLDLLKMLTVNPRVHANMAAGNPDEPTEHEISRMANEHLVLDVADQISAGMWRVLTRNVQVLTHLNLEQWQVLFDIIAVGAEAGGYASIRSFEVIAWLLHEPRLLANVPVFIIIAIRPLLCNTRVPIPVSLGAINLVCHLHSRLEVLVPEDSVDDSGDANGKNTVVVATVANGVTVDDVHDRDGDGDGDTPVLWESCWVPILRLLADAVSDSRAPVQAAASMALSRAILDRHVRAVPVGVLVNVLSDIIVPVVLLLGEESVKHAMQRAAQRSRTGTIQSENTDAMVGISIDDPSGTSWGEVEVESYGKDVLKSVEQNRRDSHTAGSHATIPVVECMRSLEKVFREQLYRLSVFPTFDKLLLRMLHMFGYFLGAPHGFDHSILSNLDGNGNSSVHQGIAAAGDILAAVLAMLQDNRKGIFDKRAGLRIVTQECLYSMRYLPQDLTALGETLSS